MQARCLDAGGTNASSVRLSLPPPVHLGQPFGLICSSAAPTTSAPVGPGIPTLLATSRPSRTASHPSVYGLEWSSRGPGGTFPPDVACAGPVWVLSRAPSRALCASAERRLMLSSSPVPRRDPGGTGSRGSTSRARIPRWRAPRDPWPPTLQTARRPTPLTGSGSPAAARHTHPLHLRSPPRGLPQACAYGTHGWRVLGELSGGRLLLSQRRFCQTYGFSQSLTLPCPRRGPLIERSLAVPHRSL